MCKEAPGCYVHLKGVKDVCIDTEDRESQRSLHDTVMYLTLSDPICFAHHVLSV